MKRREFIQLGAGFAAASVSGFGGRAGSKDRIVVIGGGMVGAAICYRLARRGARVTLLEKSHPAAGATGSSFAWINANFTKQPRHYHALNRLGVHAFRGLHQELGAELPVRWGGTLEWYANPERADELRRMCRQQQEWGYPISFIDDARIGNLEPRLRAGKSLAATFSELEGSVDAAGATRLLLSRARSAGASIIYPCEVNGIEPDAAKSVILRTSRGEFECETVVIAAGVKTGSLASALGVTAPLVPAPGIVVRTVPQPQSIRRVLVTEDSHFHQLRDGRVVIGDDYGPPATEIHKQLASHPLKFPDPSYAALHGERIRSQAARHMSHLARARIESVSLCWRPMPADGFPIVGFAPGAPRLYLAVTHSGITLGPLIGELAALEILDGARVDLLEHYRPARFRA